MTQRESAQRIFEAALQAADPRGAVRRVLRYSNGVLSAGNRAYELSTIRRVVVVGFGKAGAPMAQAVEEILGGRIDAGLVLVKKGHVAPLAKIELFEASHPILDESNLAGTRRLLQLLSSITEQDLVICLISGGGSALLELPRQGISLQDLRVATDQLLRAGVSIGDLNAVRKHLSQVKGGQLVGLANGAEVLSLILSDVIGSPLDTIASGPTAPDCSTFAQAREILDRFGGPQAFPPSVVQYLDRGIWGEIPETPSRENPIFARVQNLVIADNSRACDAAVEQARRLGYQTLLLTTSLQGEAREAAKFFAAIAQEILRSNRPVARPACVIAGGETTVTVRGKGLGGRNQELALAAAIELKGMAGVVLLSGASDGTDGPTDAAGAIVDCEILARAKKLGRDAGDFLANNDSYHFFEALDNLLITGPTNTNVNDLIVMLVD